MDLLDRLLGHDAWTTTQVLAAAAHLTDAQLDQAFDVGHGSVRATLEHLIDNVETWTDLLAERPRRLTAQAAAPRPSTLAPPSVAALAQRYAAAAADFGQQARACRDANRLDATYMDVLDHPPRAKSVGGTLLHVLTHNHQHRAELLHLLQRLGVPNLIEGDVLSWEMQTRSASNGDPLQ
jgi:uncharacterized damage-inducible protein DinB